MNHQEVIEEDKRNKLPSNWEARKRQAEWIMNNEEKRREAEEKVIKFLEKINSHFLIIIKYTDI
jgi:pre-mRNA-splicing factor SYF2